MEAKGSLFSVIKRQRDTERLCAQEPRSLRTRSRKDSSANHIAGTERPRENPS